MVRLKFPVQRLCLSPCKFVGRLPLTRVDKRHCITSLLPQYFSTLVSSNLYVYPAAVFESHLRGFVTWLLNKFSLMDPRSPILPVMTYSHAEDVANGKQHMQTIMKEIWGIIEEVLEFRRDINQEPSEFGIKKPYETHGASANLQGI